MKKAVTVIVILIIISAGAWLIFGNKNTSNNSSTAPQNHINQQSSSQISQSQSQPTSTDAVKIENFAFSPSAITVKKGTKVTWANNDSTAHTVTENDGKNGPSSPEMAPGSSYSFTYNELGSFKYHCTLHPDMTGTVTVTD
jgi:plastocyanin